VTRALGAEVVERERLPSREVRHDERVLVVLSRAPDVGMGEDV
jgi:hypothetical protein